MITNNLAELIHSGVAKYQTWATGGTGSSRLPVPENCYVVITDFHVLHFVDRTNIGEEEAPIFDISKALKNDVHHLRFRSQSESFLYNVRTPFKMEFYDGVDFLTPVESEVKYDAYQVHTTDVHIDLWRLIDFTNWAMSISKLDDKTAEIAGPIGYGTLNSAPNQNVVRKIDFSGAGDQDFIPYGINQGLTMPLGWREQFFADINNQSYLFPPATTDADCNFTYPLVNIGYVLVKQPFLKHTK